MCITDTKHKNGKNVKEYQVVIEKEILLIKKYKKKQHTKVQ